MDSNNETLRITKNNNEQLVKNPLPTVKIVKKSTATSLKRAQTSQKTITNFNRSRMQESEKMTINVLEND